tara:strand:+ start:307 stop:621 length:315 start_codon:yes stop_codon:yes gene_type:complete
MNGIYKCVKSNKELAYIGSSGIALDKLESNHRNTSGYKNWTSTHFRDNLVSKGQDWVFEWIIEPFECDKKTIETIEGAFINELSPEYNIDNNPVASSIKYGRYE